MKTPYKQIILNLVYQGGHHNVYCNGVWHLYTTGGKCHSEILPIPRELTGGRSSVSMCDCELYKENNL
jgi:hypothetical protein